MRFDSKICSRRLKSLVSSFLPALKRQGFPTPRIFVTFFLNGHLAWNNSKLYLKGYVQSGGVWGFRDDIKPGKYSFYFKYSNLNQERRIYHQEMKKMKILDNIWTGQVETPLTKISLVLPY